MRQISFSARADGWPERAGERGDRGMITGVATLSLRAMSAAERLEEIATIMDAVDNRCMAADGDVGRFQDEVMDAELRRMYVLASGKGLRKKRGA